MERLKNNKEYRILILAAILLLITLSLAYAVESNGPAAVTKSLSSDYGTDITKIQWWIISGLFTIIQILVGGVIVSIKDDIKNVCASATKAHERCDELEKEKLSTVMHDRICKKEILHP